jgi:hypothetical protein
VSRHSISNTSGGKEQAEDCERMALNRPCEPVTAALLYAQRGWRVFPCRGKTPLTPHGFKDATTDPEAIKVWWRESPTATISVATGLQSGVVVLDIDNKAPGPTGWDSLEELGLSSLVDTPIAHTPSGGAHYYFDPLGREIPSSVGKLGACFDVKGERACCVLPTPGASYWWDPHKNPTTTPLAPAPEWLAPPPARPILKARPAGPPLGELTPYGANAINSAVSRIYTAPEGQQAITLNREAYGVGQLVGASVVPRRVALGALVYGALAMPIDAVACDIISKCSDGKWRSLSKVAAAVKVANAAARQAMISLGAGRVATRVNGIEVEYQIGGDDEAYLRRSLAAKDAEIVDLKQRVAEQDAEIARLTELLAAPSPATIH